MPEYVQPKLFGPDHPFNQLVNDGRPHARASDPTTSHLAAQSPVRMELLLDMLKLYEASAEGLTDDELAQAFPTQNPGTMSKRRLRLERVCLVERSTQVRDTMFGSPAMVFFITDLGRQVIEEWQR